MRRSIPADWPSVPEALRVLDALQHFEKHGEVCPANWTPGADHEAGSKGSQAYFAKQK